LSAYHASIAKDDTPDNDTTEEPESDRTSAADSRYWSDFSRVYYAPKSFQRLPTVADWDLATNDWASGRDLFSKFDAVRGSKAADAGGWAD
jgi:hypothetical protein